MLQGIGFVDPSICLKLPQYPNNVRLWVRMGHTPARNPGDANAELPDVLHGSFMPIWLLMQRSHESNVVEESRDQGDQPRVPTTAVLDCPVLPELVLILDESHTQQRELIMKVRQKMLVSPSPEMLGLF